MQRQKMECLNNMLQLEVHEFVLLIEEKKQIKTYKKYIREDHSWVGQHIRGISVTVFKCSLRKFLALSCWKLVAC